MMQHTGELPNKCYFASFVDQHRSRDDKFRVGKGQFCAGFDLADQSWRWDHFHRLWRCFDQLWCVRPPNLGCFSKTRGWDYPTLGSTEFGLACQEALRLDSTAVVRRPPALAPSLVTTSVRGCRCRFECRGAPLSMHADHRAIGARIPANARSCALAALRAVVCRVARWCGKTPAVPSLADTRAGSADRQPSRGYREVERGCQRVSGGAASSAEWTALIEVMTLAALWIGPPVCSSIEHIGIMFNRGGPGAHVQIGRRTQRCVMNWMRLL